MTGLADQTTAWRVFSAIIRCHQTMAEMEKPRDTFIKVRGAYDKTGDKVEVPAKRIPYFKPSKELKDLVNTESAAPAAEPMSF